MDQNQFRITCQMPNQKAFRKEHYLLEKTLNRFLNLNDYTSTLNHFHFIHILGNLNEPSIAETQTIHLLDDSKIGEISLRSDLFGRISSDEDIMVLAEVFLEAIFLLPLLDCHFDYEKCYNDTIVLFTQKGWITREIRLVA